MEIGWGYIEGVGLFLIDYGRAEAYNTGYLEVPGMGVCMCLCTLIKCAC